MPTLADLHYFAAESTNYSRPPVLLVHGAGGHHLSWPPQIRRLHGQRVFAMDLPGHGRSGGSGQDRVEDYMDAVLDFMQGLGLNAAIWIGHSMGAAIALEAALRHTRRVLGLGLVGAGARLRVDPVMLRYASEEATFSAALAMIGGRSFSSSTPLRLQELALKRMSETRCAVLHADLTACDHFDATGRLAAVLVPTLIVCGADDQLVPTRYSERLHAQIPGSELKMISHAGHMVMLEQPDQTAEILQRFVDSIAYRPGS